MATATKAPSTKKATTAKSAPKKLTDAQLADQARIYLELKVVAEQAISKQKQQGEVLASALAARSEATVETAGMKITSKRRRTREFDVEALRKMLTPAQRENVLVEKVKSSEAVDELVKKGVLPTELVVLDDGSEVQVVAGAETVKLSASYVDVTLKR